MVPPWVDGRTKLLGLIGKGIGHTLSPLIHNESMRKLGLSGLYVPFDCPAGFPRSYFFEVLWDMGALGFNVTVPYKEAAALQFSTSSPPLLSINTLYRGPNGWLSASTDGPGFMLALSRLGRKVEDFSACIFLGNGGAALALRDSLQKEHNELPHFVLRRNPSRDELWRKESRVELNFRDFSASELQKVLTRFPRSLLLQTTSAPLQGEPLEELAAVMDERFQGVLIDLVYGSPSALISRAKSLNIPCQDGVSMLVGQAIFAQKLWWGLAGDFDELELLVRRAVQGLSERKS